MDDLEASLMRIIRDNRAARLRSSARMSRLVEATAHNDQEAIDAILDEITGADNDATLGPDGAAESVDGSAGEPQPPESGGAATEESGG